MPETTNDQTPPRKTALLPVVITDAEKLIILADLSLLLTEVEKLKAEKARLPEAIKTLEGSMQLKNHALVAGVIERDVEIREEANAFNAKVKIFRVDTGEFVRERGMDPEEAQMQLGQSSVPGPAPDNVRSLAEHREKSEEQLAAGTPEEAEALREARLADEREARINQLISALVIDVIERRPGEFVASVSSGEIPGVAEALGLSGPIRPDSGAALADLIGQLKGLIMGSMAATAVDEAARAAEVEKLAAEQAKDDASGPKKLLQAPKGAKGKRRNKIVDGEDKPIPVEAEAENPNGVDTTPPPAPDGGSPLGF